MYVEHRPPIGVARCLCGFIENMSVYSFFWVQIMQLGVVYAFIFKQIRPYLPLVLVQLVIATVWAMDLTIRPYLLGVIVDKIGAAAATRSLDTLFWPTFYYLQLFVLMEILLRIYDYVWLKILPPLKAQIGDFLMQRMMHHSQSLYSSYFSGALANRMRDVMFFIPDLLKASIHSFYTNCLTIVFAMCSFYGVDSKFVYIFVLWATIYLTGLIILSTRARKMTEKVAAIRSTVLGSIVDILSNIMSVRLFSATKLESRSLKRVLDDGVAAEQDRDWRLLKLNAFQGTSFAIYQVICILLLIHGFKWGNVTPGLFVMILMLNNIVSDCLWDISEDISKLIDHIGNITQGLSIVLAPLDIKDHPHAGELKVSRGEIVFDQATFNYPEAEPFFDKLSIVIKPGQKVGLVGYSGGGKTTFVSLILRLHDVVSGRILIDGQDIRDVTQESLRHAVAMIPQDSILFHRSLMENIRYGCKDATNEEVMEVSKRAHVHDFAVRLSNGYNYMVGERGMKLSGGQRQRIALARAMLKKAPILILDEATSQLDAITEGEIQNVLLDLMQGKTTLVIAHRLSTLLHMDRILVFKHGSIVEDGTHQELIARKGHYKDLWDAQFHGILPETNGNSVSR